MENRCAVFKALGKEQPETDECHSCPFQKTCPEDIMAEAEIKVINLFADWLKKQAEPLSWKRK
ncbi:MAG: hypothetical protein V1709_09690 [Planctomycetota bacterium]